MKLDFEVIAEIIANLSGSTFLNKCKFTSSFARENTASRLDEN
jgi:hypothetical protein